MPRTKKNKNDEIIQNPINEDYNENFNDDNDYQEAKYNPTTTIITNQHEEVDNDLIDIATKHDEFMKLLSLKGYEVNCYIYTNGRYVKGKGRQGGDKVLAFVEWIPTPITLDDIIYEARISDDQILIVLRPITYKNQPPLKYPFKHLKTFKLFITPEMYAESVANHENNKNNYYLNRQVNNNNKSLLSNSQYPNYIDTLQFGIPQEQPFGLIDVINKLLDKFTEQISNMLKTKETENKGFIDSDVFKLMLLKGDKSNDKVLDYIIATKAKDSGNDEIYKMLLEQQNKQTEFLIQSGITKSNDIKAIDTALGLLEKSKNLVGGSEQEQNPMMNLIATLGPQLPIILQQLGVGAGNKQVPMQQQHQQIYQQQHQQQINVPNHNTDNQMQNKLLLDIANAVNKMNERISLIENQIHNVQLQNSTNINNSNPQENDNMYLLDIQKFSTILSDYLKNIDTAENTVDKMIDEESKNNQIVIKIFDMIDENRESEIINEIPKYAGMLGYDINDPNIFQDIINKINNLVTEIRNKTEVEQTSNNN